MLKDNQPSFLLIAGPCVVESKSLVLDIAGQIKEWCKSLNIPYIFKASYEKANRSKADSFTGIGREMALEVLQAVKDTYGLQVTTDIHSDAEAAWAAQVADVLQIPAFLCRQTSLLEAAAHTGKIVNIKKGQFMSPEAMKHAVDKVKNLHNGETWLTERGTTFGYTDLVVDFRGIPIMKEISDRVLMDCTHSLQMPNQSKGVTGGRPQYIELMAKNGLVSGVDGLFIETHPEPSKALSDGANMLPLSQLYPMLQRLKELHTLMVSQRS